MPHSFLRAATSDTRERTRTGSHPLLPPHCSADHSYASVLADLHASLRLFPEATLCGDDWCWEQVRRAVGDFADETDFQVEAHPNENWWRLHRRGAACSLDAWSGVLACHGDETFEGELEMALGDSDVRHMGAAEERSSRQLAPS